MIKIYLDAKESNESKYHLLINKIKSTELKHFNDSKALLNTQVIWMMFIKRLKNKIQIKNVKC